MKILFYIDCMQLGGAQRVMKNLIDYALGTGNEALLINDILPIKDVEEYELSSQVRRLFLQSDELDKKQSNFNRIKKLRKILKEEKPDVFISFLGPPNIRILLASLGLPMTKIVSVRNDPYREYGTGLKKAVANAVFRLADGVVFQTTEASMYFQAGIRKKSRVIYNPVNPVFYEHEWKNDSKEMVAIGRLQKQKNTELLMKAFISIADKIPDYRLGFYGDGEIRPTLEALAEEAGVLERVVFHGRCTNIPEALEHIGLYVMSSDYEGMPNALMEAMAVGVPVISTDCPCGGPRELIQREDQGMLVPCRDVEALANAMLTMLSDEEKKIEFGRKAAERAKQFQSDIILQQWDDFIKSKCQITSGEKVKNY